MSTRSHATFARTARATITGATLGLVGAGLLANFVAKLNASSAAWALGLVVLYYSAVPMTALGALIGHRLARRRAQRDAAAALAGAPERAPTSRIGLLAGLIIGVWATILLLDVFMSVDRLLALYVGFMPVFGASVQLLLRIGTLAAIWQIGRGTSRAFSEAVDTRDGRPRLLDVAIVASLLILFALSLATMALDTLLLAQSAARLSDGAIGLGIALLIGVIARAMLRRSRYATHLALAFAALAVGTELWSVIAPSAEDHDPRQAFRDFAILTAVMAGFVVYVRWRLSGAAEQTRRGLTGA